MKIIPVCALTIALAVVMARQADAAGRSCESLLKLPLDDTTVTTAQVVAAGAFKAPGSDNEETTARWGRLPAFCRVAATVRPTADSDIKLEVWLPTSGWNRKFQAVGNGGLAGTISYSSMARAVAGGFATASTDTGHSTPGGSFAFGHPEKLIDYAYRSEHEMTIKAKALIAAFYGSGPSRSYFNGCSTGGRQALTEASRYPDDFEGIIAGSAANPKTHEDAWRLWLAGNTIKSPETRIPTEKYAAIHRAVLAACDALDGLKDGLITNPTRCNFDPQVMVCKTGDTPDCLTPQQVQSVRRVLTAPHLASTGAEIFGRLQPGSELLWTRLIGSDIPAASTLDIYRYMVFADPQWDWRTFDLDRDFPKAEQKLQGLLTGVDPGSLRAFFARGGRLLTYHGWADQNIAPMASVNFYTGVGSSLGEATVSNSMRLFMVPGMAHCGGGEGPNTFDMMVPLQQWVENGQAPTRVVASHSVNGKITRTRPLCPYPQEAVYAGTGSIDEAENFTCRLP